MSFLDILDAVTTTLIANATPLSIILIGLLVLKQLRDDIRPIFLSMVQPLQRQAQTNAVAWAIGIMLGTLASMGALVEVATQMHWVAVANICKVTSPFLATIVALIKQSPAGSAPQPTSSNATTPPFQREKPTTQ